MSSKLPTSQKLNTKECKEFIDNYKQGGDWVVNPKTKQRITSKNTIEKILEHCKYRESDSSCIIDESKITKDFMITLIFDEVNLSEIIINGTFENKLKSFDKYLDDNKNNEIIKFYKKLEKKCIDFFLNNSDYPKDISIKNILLLNKQSLHKYINDSRFDYLINKAIHKDILVTLLETRHNYNTENHYYEKLFEKECDIYARLYYIQVFLQKKLTSYDNTNLETYQNYLINTLNQKIKLNIIVDSDTVGISSSRSSGNNRWKTTPSTVKRYFSAPSPLKLKKKSIKRYSLTTSKKLSKETILHNIESKCINMEDPYTLESFEKFPRKKLNYLIYIQAMNKKYHCFYVKSLYKAMNSLIQSGIDLEDNFKNPLTNVGFKKVDINQIMAKMSIMYPTIKIPRKKMLYRDDIVIGTLYIRDFNRIDVQFLNIRILYYLDKGQTEQCYHVLKDIAIPLHIDNHPSLSCTASAILMKITDIIEKGQLVSLTIPFTFHQAFKSNINTDDWYTNNTFNMDKYNAFCAML